MKTALPDGTLLDADVVEALNQNIERLAVSARAEGQQHQADAEAAVRKHPHFQMARRSHERVTELDAEHNKALEKAKRDLNDRALREREAELKVEYQQKLVQIDADVEGVADKLRSIEVPWSNGPEWKHPFPRDVADQTRLHLEAQTASYRTPERHLDYCIRALENGTDLPQAVVLRDTNEYLLTKKFWGPYRHQLTAINEVFEERMRTPTQRGREYAATQLKDMSVSLKGWARALRMYGPDDRVMDRNDPESLASGILAPFADEG